MLGFFGSNFIGNCVLLLSSVTLKFLITVAIANFTFTCANLYKAVVWLKAEKAYNSSSPHADAITRALAEWHKSLIWSLCSFFSCESIGIEFFRVLPVTIVVVDANVRDHYLSSSLNDVLRARNLKIVERLSDGRESRWIHAKCFWKIFLINKLFYLAYKIYSPFMTWFKYVISWRLS